MAMKIYNSSDLLEIVKLLSLFMVLTSTLAGIKVFFIVFITSLLLNLLLTFHIKFSITDLFTLVHIIAVSFNKIMFGQQYIIEKEIKKIIKNKTFSLQIKEVEINNFYKRTMFSEKIYLSRLYKISNENNINISIKTGMITGTIVWILVDYAEYIATTSNLMINFLVAILASVLAIIIFLLTYFYPTSNKGIILHLNEIENRIIKNILKCEELS